MVINENTNISANIVIKNNEGVEQVILTANATLDKSTQNLSINVYVQDKVLLANNAADAKDQYEEFYALVSKRAKELGYVVFTDTTIPQA